MKINEMLYMQVASIDEKESKKEYKSRIADIRDDQLLVEIPIDVETGKMKRLEVYDQISAYYITKDGVKHYFETEVLGFHTDVIRLMVLRKPDPSSITRIQRRTFLRIPARQEVALKLGEHLQFLAVTEDISGGGISIICDGHIPIKENDVLSCWILLHFRNGTIEHVPFRGEVIRTKSMEGGKQLAPIRFIEISESERQKIIRFCFEKQLEMRK